MRAHGYSCRHTYHSTWLIFKTATLTLLKYAGARLFEGQHIEWFICKWCKWCNFHIWWLQLLQLPYMVVATVATSQYRSCNKYAGARLFMQKHISQHLTHFQDSNTYTIEICGRTAIHADTHITAPDSFSRQQHLHYWNMRAHGYLRGNT
jgi:hypothetical protein